MNVSTYSKSLFQAALMGVFLFGEAVDPAAAFAAGTVEVILIGEAVEAPVAIAGAEEVGHGGGGGGIGEPEEAFEELDGPFSDHDIKCNNCYKLCQGWGVELGTRN